jgi:anti-anti-sigma factor
MSENFDLDGNRLTVNAELDVAESEHMRKLCDRLLSEGEGDLTVDLSAVKVLRSFSIGVLTYMHMQASSRQQSVEFIVSPETAALLERTGLGEVLKHRVRDEGNADSPKPEDDGERPDSGS